MQITEQEVYDSFFVIKSNISGFLKTKLQSGDIMVVKWVKPLLKTWIVRGDDRQKLWINNSAIAEHVTPFFDELSVELLNLMVKHQIELIALVTGFSMRCMVSESTGWVFEFFEES